MTTETNKPAFYIFIINDQRYSAFPPKAKAEGGESA